TFTIRLPTIDAPPSIDRDKKNKKKRERKAAKAAARVRNGENA
ncbi:MAG: two-component sensor histidine kinase, partial [Microbacterium sp.]|nr:two-component sensor histidine kinase [Microbacterium sp.]